MEVKKYTSPGEILPTAQEVTLNGKQYMLRKWSLRVDAWIEEKFGKSAIELLSSISSMQFGQVIYYLLDDKGRSDFKGEETLTIDEDGRETKRFVTGPERVLSVIEGKSHEADLARAMMRCYGMSQALIDKAAAQASAKKESKKKKS